jgi:uncharacterized protein DUF6585
MLTLMEEEYTQPRDVDADLAEITSRLGEPEATHRTNPRSVAWRIVLGVLIVVAASALHYAMWSGQVPWPKGKHMVKLWIIILAGMFIGPGVGLYLITFAVRGLKLWVLVYPTGLFVWHRGRVVSFPWDEIQAVQVAGLPDKAALNHPTASDGMPETVWFDLRRSQRRVFGTTLTLTRADAEQVALPSTLDEFPDLGRRVQQETFRRLFAQHSARFRDGHPLAFGPIICDTTGITVGEKRLPWRDANYFERVGDNLEIKQKGKKRAWQKCSLNDIVNLHVLIGVAVAARVPLGPP